MRGFLFFITTVVVVGGIVYSKQCRDEPKLTEAQWEAVACRDILGTWEIYIQSDSLGMIATGGIVEFAVDRNGKFMNMASDDSYWRGLTGCERSGSTYNLQLRYDRIRYEQKSPDELREIVTGSTSHVVAFELTSPNEMRQGHSGSSILIFRRTANYC